MMLPGPFRLRTKITFYFVGMVLLWTVLVVISLHFLLSRTSYQFARERGAQIMRQLMAECTSLVQYEEVAGLAAKFRGFEKSFPDIRYIVVLDVENNPIWSTFGGGVPRDLLTVPHSRKPSQEVSVQMIRSQGELIYDYAFGKAGIQLRMGLSLARVQKLVRDATAFVIWLGTLGLLGVFGLALRISRPLEMLTKSIDRVIRLDRETSGDRSFQGTVEVASIGAHFDELIDRLEERTKQLDESRKLAYLGQMSASIAHEVNNPLGVMVLNSQFLAERVESGKLDPDASAEVEQLCAAAKRATLAVQKLLQFSRHATRGEALKCRPNQLDSLIQETLDLLRDRTQVSGCSLHVSIAEDLPEVYCDRQGIQQVLFNLLTNALDASAANGEIKVEATCDRGQKAVFIRVSNEGPELTDEVIRKAKTAFFTTKELGQGIGLGLAISDSIVQAHGGELSLESQDQVTTATIRLPLKEH